MLRVQERSSEILTPRNVKLATYSTSVDMEGDMCAISLPEVHSELFGLLNVESQVVVGAPLHQVLDLFSIGRLIIVTDEAEHRCVICKHDSGITCMHRFAGEGGVDELGTQPCGTPVFRVRAEEVWSSNLTDWGRLVRKSSLQYPGKR